MESDEPAANKTPSPIPPGEIEIVIGEDGSIVFTDLPGDLLEIALELDPEAELTCPLPIQVPVEKTTS
jgi:hypothetical protein